jgi:hypothetical protein
MSTTTPATAWGPAAHAVIGQLVEDDLLKHDAGLRAFLWRLREPAQRPQVRDALLGMEPPEPGQALRALANWPDQHKRQPGMLPYDEQRHYVNLPHTARYHRARHCPHGRCSLETLLQQRAILADRRAPLPQRVVALAWVTHLIGDMHQPLHAGKQEDRGGNLTCVAWRGEPSRLVTLDDSLRCSGANLHALWDGKIIEAVTGLAHPDDASAFAQQLQPLLKRVKAAELPVTARTDAQWRPVVERWHAETHALIRLESIYPEGNNVTPAYVQRHYQTMRLQVLRAAVRLAAMLRQALNP